MLIPGGFVRAFYSVYTVYERGAANGESTCAHNYCLVFKTKYDSITILSWYNV